MRMYDIIAKKRDGKKLDNKDIAFFINGYIKEQIPDYQASAFLMAAFLNGLDDDETVHLTKVMASSGDMADLRELGTVADKHSTGGVADTTTLIVVPLVCACGLKVAKMSGRGLGHTGGTLDKLESIPGMSVSLEMNAFMSQVKRIGGAVIGQTMNMCPADKMLYALRDVTATVESIPLIASSIMSKKLASGSNIIMLDVKTGSGAFMTDPDNAQKLANTMVRIGNMAGRKTAAIISDMSQPLGLAVGNSLEVIEAIDVLSGRIQGDLLTVSLSLASRMLCLANIAKNDEDANAMLLEALHSKRALHKFGEIITAQGGNTNVIHDTSLMPHARIISTLHAKSEGILTATDCKRIGEAAGMLGAGRLKKDDIIDPAVGFIIKKRIGDTVKYGDELFEVHANDENKIEEAMKYLEKCITLTNSAKSPTLIYGLVSSCG